MRSSTKHEDVKHQFSLTGRQLLPSSVLAHSQSRVNSVRVTEGKKGAIGRGLRDRPGPTVGRNMLEVWGWGSPKRGGGQVIHNKQLVYSSNIKPPSNNFVI